jgi:hypothetical protein
MHKKKINSKNVMEIYTFSFLLMFVKSVLLITFFGAFFKIFFNGFEISMNEAFFDIFFDLTKFCEGHNITYLNFKAKRTKMGKYVLDFNFALITGSGFFIF